MNIQTTPCTQVTTIPQFTSTCWFNAILTAVCYSQYMRTLVMHKIGDDTPVKKIIATIIQQYYANKEVYMNFYKAFNPGKILTMLNEENSSVFDVLNCNIGYQANKYIHKIVDYVGIRNYTYLDAILKEAGKHDYTLLFKPSIVKEGEIISEQFVNDYFKKEPDVLLISTQTNLNPISANYPEYFKKQDITFDASIKYNDKTYLADSMIIDNFNDRVCNKGHSICGITCNYERYLYNGWMATTIDRSVSESDKPRLKKIPWGLKQHDWLDRTKEQFCLDIDTCDIRYLETKNAKLQAVFDKEMCFSFSKGSRIFVYVREDLIKELTGGTVVKPMKYRYKNRLYKLRTGSRGGKFIIVKGKVVRISKNELTNSL